MLTNNEGFAAAMDQARAAANAAAQDVLQKAGGAEGWS